MTFRRLAIAALAVPFLAGCVSNETLGTRLPPAGGPLFSSYVALGTSIAAGSSVIARRREGGQAHGT